MEANKNTKKVRFNMEKHIGIVNHIRNDRGFGFVTEETINEDGDIVYNLANNSIYFHANSVVEDRFSELTKGTRVIYEIIQQEKGLEAKNILLYEEPDSAWTTE